MWTLSCRPSFNPRQVRNTVHHIFYLHVSGESHAPAALPENRSLIPSQLEVRSPRASLNVLEKGKILDFKRSPCSVCFLLSNSPASEYYMPTFWNTSFHLHRQIAYEGGSVPKRRHIKFRRRGITQTKTYRGKITCFHLDRPACNLITASTTLPWILS
jgi:hypothetical protein